MDLIGYLKEIGSGLATAASLAYISGYLVLRARANALGTDPTFTLVDQAYVFAGFRFLFVTLVVVLCISPVVVLIHLGALKMNAHIPLFWDHLIQWVLLVLLALVTLFALKVTSVSNLLFQPREEIQNSNLAEAIMGTQSTLGVLMTIAMVFVTTLAVYWLKVRLTEKLDGLTWVLAVVVALLVFMLPIYHGVLFADRKVRLLARVPETVKGLYKPVGIVDHTKEHYTLLGRNEEGSPCLTTVKQESLNGIPIKGIKRLNRFVDLLATSDPIKTSQASTIQNNEGSPMASNDSDLQKSFFKTLLDHLHMVFESIGSLGDGAVQAGQLWSVELDDSGQPSKPVRLGALNNLAWPVVGANGETIYALQQGKVVKLAQGGNAAEVVHSNAHWIKLLGTSPDNSILGMIYLDGQIRPAILAESGDLKIPPSANTPEDQTQLAKLMQESRAYTNNRALYVDRSERGGRGFDVYFKSNDHSVNLTDCGNDTCGHASIAPNFKSVLFIRQSRY